MFRGFLILTVLLSYCVFAQELKDANLFQSVAYGDINVFLQKKKNYKDKKHYQKYKTLLSCEEHEIYLILDKILRANNLQYKNWRFGFNIDKDTINAISFNNNLILLNSSLYDSLHQNKDALAFALAHELAHFILSCNRETIENNYKIQKLENDIKKLSLQKNGEIYSKNLKKLINNIYLSQKTLELNCDSLALEFILRAGYDLNLALEIFEYIDENYVYIENKSLYPLIYERKDNLLKQFEILNVENLIKEGKNNLFKSEVLSIQKSVDKQTLVINKPFNYKEYTYIPQTDTQKLLNKGYYYYNKKDIKNAIKFFLKAQKENPNNYIAPLYLSYSYEYLGDIKLAKRYIKKARSLKPRDLNIIEQYKALYKK